MPVILKREAHNIWLDPSVKDVERLKLLLLPYPAELMLAYPMSRAVGNPANDSPACVKPAIGLG